MTERQLLIWLLSVPACAEASNSIQELTKVVYNSGEQNKGASKSKQERDMKDSLIILQESLPSYTSDLEEHLDRREC